MTSCLICSKRVPRDGGVACQPCIDGVEDMLIEAHDLYRSLDATMTTGGDSGGRRAPGFRSTSPGNDFAISLMDRRSSGGVINLHTMLDSWAGFVAEARGYALSASLSLVQVCRYIQDHIDWMSEHTAFLSFRNELLAVTRQLRKAHGIHEPQPIGRCWAPTESDEMCGYVLWPPAEGESVVICQACETHYYPMQILEVQRAAST